MHKKWSYSEKKGREDVEMIEPYIVHTHIQPVYMYIQHNSALSALAIFF